MDGKENGRTPAAAFVEFDTSDGHDNGRYPIWAQHAGLTKRELFAAMAMQGFLSVMASPEVLGSIAMGAKEAGVGTDQYVAAHAVAQADALLAALNAEESK